MQCNKQVVNGFEAELEGKYVKNALQYFLLTKF